MRDYNHDGKIDKNDFVIEEMLIEDDIQDNHGNSDFISSMKGLGLVIIGLAVLLGIVKLIFLHGG